MSEEDQILIDLLRIELSHPESSLETGENLCVTLFSMVTKFCSGAAPHFPMKKVLLVLWKIILFKLGGNVLGRNTRSPEQLWYGPTGYFQALSKEFHF